MDISNSILSAAILLFLVMDPLGNIPIFLSLLKDIDESKRRRIILREVFIALGILLVFLFMGQKVLSFLQLQQESVSISGGIVLFLIGIRMIFPTGEGVMGAQLHGEPFIVPLATPLIAGPSALATLILMVGREPARILDWLFALAAIERLMGMLLIMVSVQMLLNGIRNILQ